MTITNNQIKAFSEKIADLYEHILLSDIPEEAAFLGYLDQSTQFALDENGYHKSYFNLLQSVFQLPSIGEMWSEDGIQDLGHQLLLNLAETKKLSQRPPDFFEFARIWLEKINIEFKESTCYIAIAGLSVEMPLELGDVTILPVHTQIPEFIDDISISFQEKLNPNRDSISCSKVTAEWRRSAQIHREKTEQALNVLRFIGSLIWHDQPTRHIFVASENPKRISDSIVVTENGEVSHVNTSDFTPIPLQIDSETIEYAEYFGLKQIQTLLNTPVTSEIEQSFLTAIQWFGQATQELLPLVAFVKYYIAIEAALKKPGENAKRVLPRRLGVLIQPWNPTKLAKLEVDLRSFIDERNAVFHSGIPISKTPQELQWEARILARQTLHQLRLRLNSENWQTKDDLIAWTNTQFRKFTA